MPTVYRIKSFYRIYVHATWWARCALPTLRLRIFKSNRDAGLLLFAGLLVDAVLRSGA